MFVKFKEWWNQQVHNQHPLKYEKKVFLVKGHQFIFRQAINVDIAAMVDVERQIYGIPPWSAGMFQRELWHLLDRLYLVVTDDGRIVGYVGCSFDSSKSDSHITNIGIMPAYQGIGLGTKLISQLQDFSINYGYETMSLEVRKHNYRARKLYERLGFEKTRTRFRYYLDDHEDAIEMRAELKRGEEERYDKENVDFGV